MLHRSILVPIAALAALGTHTSAFAGQGSEWNSSGGDRQNTRSQPSEHTLSPSNVGGLTVKWTTLSRNSVRSIFGLMRVELLLAKCTSCIVTVVFVHT
jgi:hypothetical protein